MKFSRTAGPSLANHLWSTGIEQGLSKNSMGLWGFWNADSCISFQSWDQDHIVVILSEKSKIFRGLYVKYTTFLFPLFIQQQLRGKKKRAESKKGASLPLKVQSLRSIPLPHAEQHYNCLQNLPQLNSIRIISIQNLEIPVWVPQLNRSEPCCRYKHNECSQF